MIDAHTHYQLVSRGTVTADKFYDGSVLAAFGGVTTVIDFSDHLPERRIAEGAYYRNNEASGEMAVDWALHQVITDVGKDTEAELIELKEAGVTAIKIFTTYKNAGYFIEKENVEQLFRICKELDILVTIHAEDDGIIEENLTKLTGDGYPPQLLPLVRPAQAEYRAIMDYGKLAGTFDMPVYIVHLSSGPGLDAVRELKRDGVRVYAETTPHYLLLTDDLLSGENPQKYVMTPPLRKREIIPLYGPGLNREIFNWLPLITVLLHWSKNYYLMIAGLYIPGFRVQRNYCSFSIQMVLKRTDFL